MADSVAVGRRWSIAPYFIVDDVVTTANYYRDQLGFHYERFWNEPPSFCMVTRNGIVLMLAQLERTGVMRPNRTVDPEGGAWDNSANNKFNPDPSQTVRIGQQVWDEMLVAILGVTVDKNVDPAKALTMWWNVR